MIKLPAISKLRKDSNSGTMITPPALKQGDKIAIVATARKVSEEEIAPSVKILENWGYEVVKGMNLFADDRQFAGTDGQRWAELQLALDDPSIKAILFARGGYGTVRIIDKLDFTKFKKYPKWLMGFSDVTVLHTHVNHHCKVQTMHSPMALTLPLAGKEVKEHIQKILHGGSYTMKVKNHLLNRRGKVAGELIGGNLSILYSLTGTASDIHTRGKILFIEDLDEYLYHIDRMMMNLKRSGKLDGLKGLIVGGMTDMNDNKVPYGLSAEEIILDAVTEYDYPVCFGFPAGHLDNNHPLVMGKKITLEVSSEVTLLI